MRRKSLLPFIVIFLVLLFLMSRSKSTSDAIRSASVAAIAPLWKLLSPSHMENGDTYKLQAENQLLRNEIARMQELVKEAYYLKKELHQLYVPNESPVNYLNDLKGILKKRLEAVPARVIYRASSSWNCYLWIDVGKATNELFKRTVVSKNSPVVVGNALIGVIDYVGEYQARVRLITDSSLYPAVRAARGLPQRIRLVETINVLLDNLASCEDLLEDGKERETICQQLEHLQKTLVKAHDTLYLAKGELQGCSHPRYRSHGNLLKGIGFNCDFSDEKSPARDLRTGIPYSSWKDAKPIALLKPHDILITSGLDGIFPEGLQVAEVMKVSPLEEGDYFYKLQAKPIVGNLDSLEFVFVLPPQGFDPEEIDMKP